MKAVLSNRKWKLITVNNSEQVDLETIYEKSEQESDYEFNYALQDRIDDLLDMQINDTIYFQFNRDDENDKGIVVRVK